MGVCQAMELGPGCSLRQGLDSWGNAMMPQVCSIPSACETGCAVWRDGVCQEHPDMVGEHPGLSGTLLLARAGDCLPCFPSCSVLDIAAAAGTPVPRAQKGSSDDLGGSSCPLGEAEMPGAFECGVRFRSSGSRWIRCRQSCCLPALTA